MKHLASLLMSYKDNEKR